MLAVGVPVGILALLIAAMSALRVESGTNKLTPGELDAAELCADCHEDETESLAHTAHQVDAALAFSELNCAKCHAGAEVHVEDPELDNIANPANLSEGDLINLCSSCHMPHYELNYLGLGQELDVSLNCLDCHNGNVAATNIESDINKTNAHFVMNYSGIHDPAELSILWVLISSTNLAGFKLSGFAKLNEGRTQVTPAARFFKTIIGTVPNSEVPGFKLICCSSTSF